MNNLKTQRINDEVKLRVLKWNFAVPRDEFVDQLKEQMNTAGVNKSLMTNMYHADFKFHIKAIDSLNEVIVCSLLFYFSPFTKESLYIHVHFLYSGLEHQLRVSKSQFRFGS